MRGFRLKIQAGGPAFLRLPPFFPVVGNAEVSGSFIDTEPERSTDTKHRERRKQRYWQAVPGRLLRC